MLEFGALVRKGSSSGFDERNGAYKIWACGLPFGLVLWHMGGFPKIGDPNIVP